MKPKCCLLDNNKTSTRVKLNHFIMQHKEEPHGSGGMGRQNSCAATPTDKAKTSGQPTKAAQAEVVEEGAQVNALMPTLTSMKVRYISLSLGYVWFACITSYRVGNGTNEHRVAFKLNCSGIYFYKERKINPSISASLDLISHPSKKLNLW